MEKEKGWIGCDLDGTLATWYGWGQTGDIGEPIKPMIKLLKHWLELGYEVRILTARVAASGKYMEKVQLYDNQEFADFQRKQIEAWCLKHIGQVLKVTATKDMEMFGLYDDRAISVEPNTGRTFSFREEFYA